MNDAAPREPAADVDGQHPWLGLDSFSEATRSYFHGRDEEVAELGRRVQRKLLTILFGQSGLGKTSILRAGLVPRLRPLGYCPVYVRIDYAPESPPPSEQIKGAIFRATLASGTWTQTGAAVEGETLWEFLHHRDDVLRDETGRTLVPLLIFDQFEEIFTLAQTDEAARRRAAEFVAELADLVENRPPRALEERIERDEAIAERFDFARGDYRILIALREDYLAHLEGLKGSMPSVTQNRMRLARMTGSQALEAVVKPGGRLVNEEVAESIVRFTAGGVELRNAEVEPALLSLICRELNNARIAQGRAEISADVLAGSRDTILADFYERSLADQPAGVRQVIEDNLLTESGYRESLAEERLRKLLAAAGAAPDALAKLVDRRLLRVEERLDVRRVELTHDVLAPVVRASRDLRLEREARDEAERKLQAQRERERATRAALVRARKIAAGCAVLAVIAIASAIYGYVSARRAQQAEVAALHTRALAESARSEAEKLVVYLLEDFYLELEPVGRLDIVANLSKRALDYYAALPPELRTDETERNRALARVRYGYVLRNQSKLDEADRETAEAIAVLTKMREKGDASEATAVGLGLGLLTQAKIFASRNKRSEALQAAKTGTDIVKPLASVDNPSVAARRAYAMGLLYLGFEESRGNEEETAVRHLQTAREILLGIAGPDLADMPAAAAFVEASGWQVSALRSTGDYALARAHGDEAIAMAGRILARRPGHMLALRGRALLNGELGNVDAEEMQPGKAEPRFRQAAEDWRTLTQLDPSNQITWNNFADSEMGVGGVLFSQGRIAASIEALGKAIAVGDNANEAGSFIALPLGLAAGFLAQDAADFGERERAVAALRANARYLKVATREAPEGSYLRSLLTAYIAEYAGTVAGPGYGVFALPYADGDFATVLRIAKESAARIEASKAPDPKRDIDRRGMLRRAYRTQAEAAYHLGDYDAATATIRRAVELGADLPKRSIPEKRDVAVEQTLAAAIAARAGRKDEAQKLIAPALAYERELYARPGNDDFTQHLELAAALQASAIAGAGRPQEDLAQALAIVDKVPPEARRLISTKRLRDGIVADAKQAR